MRNRNPPSHTPKNSMARSTSSIPGFPQLTLSYGSIAKLLAILLLSSITSTSISSLTYKLWFFRSSLKPKKIKPGPIPRFSTNSLAFTRIRIRCKRQKTSYILSSKALIRSMLL
ncbi:uncharacterized protein K444DRAFT_126946 [Hyaloscypha bicolor E]|uniref:Uncharacterized protein n=1 Tax=Hyaloscypha bicolor E TaxID=1095630 RepID=A0A2J6TUW6_9HELO|nr:uncharacterized protein K444DRAFT_126946 [Hyaloscypha bicolor E]PMD66823.1 hypothetical protein K444DRAFT_126946 [Hyaloscypha bicolor E]